MFNLNKEMNEPVGTMLLQGLRVLRQTKEPDAALQEVLRVIGVLFTAENVFLSQIDGDTARTAHQWSSLNGGLDPVPEQSGFEVFEHWRQCFAQGQSVVLAAGETLAAAQPDEFAFLRRHRIHRLVLTPLQLDDRPAGVVSIINPGEEMLQDAAPVLEALSYLMAGRIQRDRDRQKLEQVSHLDALTGARNRGELSQDMRLLAAQGELTVGVVCIDVNGMRELNARLGHEQGDEILIAVVKTIRAAFPVGDIYRLGGDEFELVVSDIPESDFNSGVWKLKSLLAEQADFHLAVGCHWSTSCADLSEATARADEQMQADKKKFYRTKADTRRYRHANDEMLTLTQPGALQRMLGDGRFTLYIQPKMSVDSRTIIGAEALIRLRGDGGLLVTPDQFIPLLEESRLISLVDFYVFEQVCNRILRWKKEGKQVVPVSVNFSRYSLTEKYFGQRLEKVWERCRVPLNLIEIEITESMSMEDNDIFLKAVGTMQQMGFTISIDDFGIKQANLSLFSTIKFDVLKVDKTLVDNLQHNETSQIVLQSVSDICRRMGIHLVVEGVETEAQFTILKRLGCESAQGYLFDRPIPMEDFVDKYLPDHLEKA